MPIVTNELQFDDMYLASKSPAVQALMKAPLSQRKDIAERLANLGELIDNAIMVWGYGAFREMSDRIMFHMTWVPSGHMLPLGDINGYALPGYTPTTSQVAYDPNHMPPGAIKVSLDSADYPAYNPPKPVTPPAPVTSAVGINVGNGQYFVTTMGHEMYQTGQLALGQTYTGDPRGTFILMGSPDPFAPLGMQIWFVAKK